MSYNFRKFHLSLLPFSAFKSDILHTYILMNNYNFKCVPNHTPLQKYPFEPYSEKLKALSISSIFIQKTKKYKLA